MAEDPATTSGPRRGCRGTERDYPQCPAGSARLLCDDLEEFLDRSVNLWGSEPRVDRPPLVEPFRGKYLRGSSVGSLPAQVAACVEMNCEPFRDHLCKTAEQLRVTGSAIRIIDPREEKPITADAWPLVALPGPTTWRGRGSHRLAGGELPIIVHVGRPVPGETDGSRRAPVRSRDRGSLSAVRASACSAATCAAT